jgi:cytochrome c peroxidase
MSLDARLRLVAIAVAAGWACTPATAQPSDRRVLLHGATPMDEQQRAIDRLGIGKSRGPVWIDPRVWQLLIPADNQPGLERVALGRALYFDRRLSADGSVACATCHDVAGAMTDRRPMAEGIGGKVGRRNTPTTMNAALLGSQFWDGRVGSLEAQALLPIVNPIEMGQPNGEAAVRAIAADPRYQALFHDAYGRPPNYADIGRALASFERTLIFLDSPFDRYLRGDRDAIPAAAERGWALFNGKARCITCHPMNPSNPLGTDDRFHNIGVSARHQNFDALAVRALAILERDASVTSVDALALETDASELGRFLVSRNQSDIGAFRTPQVRNVGVTAPYMHDGSLATLWDVLDHYNKGGETNRFLDGGIEPLALEDREIDELVEFLFAMTDLRFAGQNLSERARQRQVAGKRRPFRNDDLAFRRVLALERRIGGGIGQREPR